MFKSGPQHPSTALDLDQPARSHYVPRMGSRRPTPLDLLGTLADFGVNLSGKCRKCGRTRVIETEPLAEQYGRHTPYILVTNRMKCTGCGHHRIDVERLFRPPGSKVYKPYGQV